MDRRRQLLLLKAKLIIIQLMEEEEEEERNRKKPRVWVRPLWLTRPLQGESETAMELMRTRDPVLFYRFYRMTPAVFDKLLDLVKSDLTKQVCVREPITAKHRLGMTIRYLASGTSFADVALAFRCGVETCREAVHLTCRVLWTRLVPTYMKPPSEAQWRQIAEGFGERWQFPNCVGAVDGKHVQIFAPKNSGSEFFNYKKTFSIVLMAVVDSHYKFVLVDVGAPGRHSDGGVFKNSSFGRLLEEGTLDLPGPHRLPKSQKVAPHVFVGDEAFQLRPDFMRPFPGKGLTPSTRVFNYRLSRARRIVENAFGILSARFRILLGSINLAPENAQAVIKATCVLHNFLCCQEDCSLTYCPPNFVDREDCMGNRTLGQWRSDVVQGMPFELQPTTARNFSQRAAEVRNLMASYFVAEGAVPWQWAHAGLSAPATNR